MGCRIATRPQVAAWTAPGCESARVAYRTEHIHVHYCIPYTLGILRFVSFPFEYSVGKRPSCGKGFN
jgi:hypothetical protein